MPCFAPCCGCCKACLPDGVVCCAQKTQFHTSPCCPICAISFRACYMEETLALPPTLPCRCALCCLACGLGDDCGCCMRVAQLEGALETEASDADVQVDVIHGGPGVLEMQR